MNRQQIILSLSAAAAVLLLFVFGNTIPPKKNVAKPTATENTNAPHDHSVEFAAMLTKAKERLTAEQTERITRLENSVTRGNVKEQQIHIYHQLARFWKDSAKLFEPYAHYTAEAAKLENSEKNLTFAAHQFLDNLLIEADPAMQHWLAENAKVLFEQALQLNPKNDSSIIGLGACYMLGNISDNPMQGILPVREIVKKNPDNLYAQLILGLGGKKSGQYDKAIERFLIIAQKQPDNLEGILHLAECYDLKGDKTKAIEWYTVVRKKIPNQNAQKELDNRINQLKQ